MISLTFCSDHLLCAEIYIQEFEKQYPDANVLLVTVTDEESRRIEQQSDIQTKAEIVEILRKMFPGKDVPDATDILVPRWWSNRFYRGTFSNWPIGVNRYEYDQLRVLHRNQLID
jgi:polyamine oxidase